VLRMTGVLVCYSCDCDSLVSRGSRPWLWLLKNVMKSVEFLLLLLLVVCTAMSWLLDYQYFH